MVSAEPTFRKVGQQELFFRLKTISHQDTRKSLGF